MCIVLVFVPKDECKGTGLTLLGLPCGQRRPGPALAEPWPWPPLEQALESQPNGSRGGFSECWQTAAPKSVEHTYTFLIFHGMVQELNLSAASCA